jgi:hypothetical protein
MQDGSSIPESMRTNPKEFEETLRNWIQEIEKQKQIAQTSTNQGDRKMALLTIRDLIHSIELVKKQKYSPDEIGVDGENHLNEVINEAKKVEDQLTPPVEKMFEKLGKLLTGVALAFSLHFGKEKINDYTAVQNEISTATEHAREEGPVEIPEDSFIWGTAEHIPTPETQKVFEHFKRSAEKSFHGGLRIMQEDFAETHDFEKTYAKYKPQLSMLAPKADSIYVKKTSRRGRTH